ncbi:MAG: hypothetical protein Tsb009_25790 [Planctomycetaceae bacterium]
MSDPLRITLDDLNDPRIDEAIERERALKMLAERANVGFMRRFFFSSVMYTAIVGLIGGFLGWAIIEPMYGETETISGTIKEWSPETSAVICPKCHTFQVFEPKDRKRDTCQNNECKTEFGNADHFQMDGLIKLEKTDVYLISGRTKIIHKGKKLIAGDKDSTAMLKQGVKIRAVVALVLSDGNFAGKNYPAPALEIEVDSTDETGEPDLAKIAKNNVYIDRFFFAIVGGMIALLIGAVEGLVSLNPRQALLAGVIGLGIGFGGGFIGGFPANFLYTAMSLLTENIAAGADRLHGMPFFSQIIGRSVAWGMVGMASALGQGVARKSGKMALHGVIGGCLGGLFGGMFFDPIAKMSDSYSGDLSRCVGCSMVGLMIGLFTGIVEQLSKEAWLIMRAGPLAGKQFVVYKNPTLIGSSQHCDIYLFKDSLVNDEHARLSRIGREFEIEDLNNPSRTTVNGNPVQKSVLRDGDLIVIGQTELEYRSRGT